MMLPRMNLLTIEPFPFSPSARPTAGFSFEPRLKSLSARPASFLLAALRNSSIAPPN